MYLLEKIEGGRLMLDRFRRVVNRKSERKFKSEERFYGIKIFLVLFVDNFATTNDSVQ